MTDMIALYTREVEQDLADQLALRCGRRERLQQNITTAAGGRRRALERLDAELARRIAQTERKLRDFGDVRDLLTEATGP